MSNYFKQYGDYVPLIKEEISNETRFIIVIPVHHEPDLIRTLNSLSKCEQPGSAVEVICYINAGEQQSSEIKNHNLNTYNNVLNWKENAPDFLSIHPILNNELKKKHAGVGLARRKGMDEAAWRLQNKNGVIICLDADCEVAPNYLNVIQETFTENPTLKSASVYFEHSLDETESIEIREGIILYELFLRYYVEGLKKCQYPFPFHTIGSCMIVRSDVYLAQGGMNKRKAGEDFYFMHKLFPLGDFKEINGTCVYPSARVSDRVPFGTGKAIGQWLNRDKDLQMAYNFEIFDELKKLFDNSKSLLQEGVSVLNSLEKATIDYLNEIKFENALQEIKANVADEKQAIKRYYRYWDGLRLLKLVHYLRDKRFSDQPLIKSASEMMGLPEMNAESLLIHYRQIQKKQP